jgi:NAD(P)-dependent dehydrogenase (short-subunit alcohol dehydrogenase family)
MSGRVVLVAGASAGIGRSIALSLAARGATVWAVARGEAGLRATAGAAQGTVHVAPADVRSADDRRALADRIEAAGGRLDALVHCVGDTTIGRIEEAGEDAFDALYEANLRAPYAMTRTLLPMLRAGGGDLVFVNSTSALGPRPGVGQYAATQAALRSIADAARGELNTEGVRVLSVFAGRTASPRQERIHAAEGRDYAPERLMQPEDVAAMVTAALELPRSAEVMELAMRPFLKPPP